MKLYSVRFYEESHHQNDFYERFVAADNEALAVAIACAKIANTITRFERIDVECAERYCENETNDRE